MAKAMIMNVSVENLVATVEYATGTVKAYPIDKLPKTVQDFLAKVKLEAAHLEMVKRVAAEEPKADEEEPVKEEPVKGKPVALAEPIADEVKDEPVKVMAEPIRKAEPMRVVEVVTPSKPVVVPVMSTQMSIFDILWALADGTMALWFALTTYLLIGWDRVVALAPSAGVWMRKAGSFLWTWAKAGLIWGLGWACALILAGAGLALSIGRGFKAGWAWRAELIAA